MAGTRLPNRFISDCIVGAGTFFGKGQAIYDFTGLFVAGNTFDLTINGVPIVQVPFATNQNVTMRNIATAINAHAAVSASAVTAVSISRIIIEGTVSGTPLTFSGLTIAGGATQPVAQFLNGTGGNYQEQAAIMTLETPVGGGATEATQLQVLAAVQDIEINADQINLNTDTLEALITATNVQVTSKIDRIKGAANYNRAFTYAAAEGAAGGANVATITHTGTTLVGAETLTETITYTTPLIDGARITAITYS